MVVQNTRGASAGHPVYFTHVVVGGGAAMAMVSKVAHAAPQPAGGMGDANVPVHPFCAKTRDAAVTFAMYGLPASMVSATTNRPMGFFLHAGSGGWAPWIVATARSTSGKAQSSM